MKRSQYRWKSPDLLRVLALIGIVMYHGANEIHTLIDRWSWGSMVRKGYLGVDLLFVLSGFLLALSYMRKGNITISLREFLKKRLIRLYYPYLLIMLPLALLYILLRPASAGYLDAITLIKNIVLYPQIQPIIGPSWALTMEVFFSVLFGIFFLREGKRGPDLIGWYTVGIVIYRLFLLPFFPSLYPSRFTELWDVTTSLYFVEFAAGIWAANLFIAYGKRIKATRSIFFLALISVVCGFWFSFLLNPEIREIMRPFSIGLPFAFLIFSLMLLEQKNKLKIPAWIAALSESAFTVFLLHTLIQEFLAKKLYRLFPVFFSDHYVWLTEAVLVSISLVYPILFYYLVEKPLKKRLMSFRI